MKAGVLMFPCGVLSTPTRPCVSRVSRSPSPECDAIGSVTSPRGLRSSKDVSVANPAASCGVCEWDPEVITDSLVIAPHPTCLALGGLADPPAREGLLQRRALHIHGGQQLVQPLRHPPRPLTEEEHQRRDERHTDEEGVEEHARTERETEDLNERQQIGRAHV